MVPLKNLSFFTWHPKWEQAMEGCSHVSSAAELGEVPHEIGEFLPREAVDEALRHQRGSRALLIDVAGADRDDLVFGGAEYQFVFGA